MNLLFFCCFFFSLSLVLKFFKKKLLVLLFLELSFLCLILIYFNSCYCASIFNSLFSSFFFLVFIVLDSVFGLCLLVLCSRGSSFSSSFNLLES